MMNPLKNRMSRWEQMQYSRLAAKPGGLFEQFDREFSAELATLLKRQEETLRIIQRLKVKAKMWKWRDRGFFHQMG